MRVSVGSLIPRLFAGLVLALAVSPTATDGALASTDAWMHLGGLTSQPIGHYEFCRMVPAECSIQSGNVKPLALTHAMWRRLVEVNETVNTRIRPETDFDIYGKDEVWAYPDKGAGDCEDYVLLKRRLLMQSGISPANLLITVVRKRDGEGHAVLSVRTDRGDFILDNLTGQIRDWADTDYTYLKRQSSHHTGRWVTIEAPRNILVGSVR